MTASSPDLNGAPVIAVAGFEGPLDWLLEMARAQRIDLAKLSIVEIVGGFVAALDAALAYEAGRADLSRWTEWLGMAASLALLRSRLLLPPDAPEARMAQDEAEAIRRQLIERAAIRAATEWLDHRQQLGRDVFARGAADAAAAQRGRTTDVADLFRACLVALRVPDLLDADPRRFVTLWRIPDAMARITAMLAERPEGAALGCFLPQTDPADPDRELRGRAALASTFWAGLELARSGTLGLRQDRPWQEIQMSRDVPKG